MKKFFKKDENGGAELVSTLFVVPIIVFLLFTMIEMGMYFNTKAQVEMANRDGVRQAALWGGTSKAAPINNTAMDVAQIIDKQLGANSKSTCSTSGSTNGVAKSAGQLVTCQTNYDYQPVAAGIFMFGLGDVIEDGITVTESSFTEVGYN